MKSLVLLVALVTVIGCGAPDKAAPRVGATPATAAMSPTCKLLHDTCEPFEDKGGAGQKCHEMGHSSTEEQCAAKKVECMAACAPK